MRGLAWILVLLYSLNAIGQDSTLQQIDLNEFNVVELNSKSDPLNEYFKGNRFSLTENAMTRIPTISLVSRGNFAPEPIFRGFSGGQVNLTIDGMHVFGACTDKMDPISSYVETNNLQEIKAGNEANSNSNGGGLGGCIDMKTVKPNRKKNGVYGHVAAGYQSVSNGFNTSVGVGFNDKFLSGIFSGTFRTNEDYKDGNGDFVKYTQFSKTNLSAKLVSNFSKTQRIKIDYIYDRAWNVGYAALPMDVSLAQANIYSLTYEHFFYSSNLKELDVKVYGNNIYHEMDDSKRPDVPIRMDMPGWSDTYGSFITLKWRNKKGHKFSLKGDGFVHYAKAEMTMYPPEEVPMFMLTWPDIQRYVIGLFASDIWSVTEDFNLNYSLRFDYANSRLKTEFGKDHLRVFGYDVDNPIQQRIWNATIEPIWRLNDEWELGWIAAFKQRLPTISEQYGFYLFNAQDGYDYIGNPNLNPESALQADMSVNFKERAFSFSASAFYYYLDNYIVGVVDPELSTMTIGANGVKVYEALDHAFMTGFEVSALLNLKRITWVNVINFTFGRDSNKEVLPQLPPLHLTSTFTFKGKNWDVSPEIVGAIKKEEVRVSYGEKSAPAWMIANLRASYYLHKKTDWTFQAGIENIFNSYYYTFLDWGQVPRPGINLYLNVSFQF
jgi:iron complex outermembrane receptor protein